jgi:hypothetical protein
VKSLPTTDDGRQVMEIVHLDLWSRWTKNDKTHTHTIIRLQKVWGRIW